MNERTRIILGFGDRELLKFHAMGGFVPDELVERLQDLLADHGAMTRGPRRRRLLPHDPPDLRGVVRWTEACSAKRARAARVRNRIKVEAFNRQQLEVA